MAEVRPHFTLTSRKKKDKNINFKRHVQNICRKANNKTKALLHIRKFLTLEQAQVLAEAYIFHQVLEYCPLIWMFCSKMSDNLIVKTHYRTLRAIYDTQTGSYEELLYLSGKISISKISKFWWLKFINASTTKVRLSHRIILSKNNTPYHLGKTQLLELSKCRTKTYGLNNGALLWNKLSNHFKKAKSLIHLKNKIREWKARSCTCCICS